MDAADFRALAEKCRALASRSTDDATIAALRDVAAYYDRAALGAEDSDCLAPMPPAAKPV